VLAAVNGLQDETARRPYPAQQLDDDIAGVIMQQLLHIVGQYTRLEGKASVRDDINFSDAGQLKGETQPLSEQLRILMQYFDNAGTDGPETD